MQCAAVCCSVLHCISALVMRLVRHKLTNELRALQCVVVCCSVLQCAAVCSVSQCIVLSVTRLICHIEVMSCVYAVCCSESQCVAVSCSVLQSVEVGVMRLDRQPVG